MSRAIVNAGRRFAKVALVVSGIVFALFFAAPQLSAAREFKRTHAIGSEGVALARAALVQAARAVLVRRAQEHHDYEFAAAAIEGTLAAHPPPCALGSATTGS